MLSRAISSPGNALVNAVLCGLLALVFAFKFYCAVIGYPGSWCDEVICIEPAVHFTDTGSYAAPGIARQLAVRGMPGTDHAAYSYVPLGSYARIPIFYLIGDDLRARRIADCCLLVLATLSLFLVLKPWCSRLACLFGVNLFILHSMLTDNVGRPDNLSLALGLLAFAAWQRQSGTTSLWAVVGMGFLVGLSGLAHQFGCVFWGSLIVVAKLAQEGWTMDWRMLVRWLFWYGVGGLAGTVLPWLPQVALDPGTWWQQYAFGITHKFLLGRNFWVSFWVLAADAVQNPVLFLILPAGLWFLWLNTARRGRLLAVAAWLAVVIVWRCWSFEPSNPWYFVHFWALLCLMASLSIDRLLAGNASQPSGKTSTWLVYAEVVAALLVGLRAQCWPAGEVFFQSAARIHVDDVRLLQANVTKQECVLAAPQFYFDVPSTNKCLWMWCDQLDLNQFDVVVGTFQTKQQVQVVSSSDQWGDSLTPTQASIFMTNFELVAASSLPTNQHRTGLEKYLRWAAAADLLHIPSSIHGCYIYRNRHSKNQGVAAQ